jgi:hypothetical protein
LSQRRRGNRVSVCVFSIFGARCRDACLETHYVLVERYKKHAFQNHLSRRLSRHLSPCQGLKKGGGTAHLKNKNYLKKPSSFVATPFLVLCQRCFAFRAASCCIGGARVQMCCDVAKGHVCSQESHRPRTQLLAFLRKGTVATRCLKTPSA